MPEDLGITPPSEEAIHKAANKEKIKETIKRNQSEMWGWKDPRTALTIQEYLPYLDDDTYLIAIFRKPQKVREDLARTCKVDYKDSPKLIKEYNERIIKAIKKFLKQ